MTDKSYVELIKQKLSRLGDVVTRSMMGEWLLYLNGKLVGDICDNKLFLKKCSSNEEFLKDCPQLPPYKGAKPMYAVDISDDDFLCEAVYRTFLGAPEPRKK